MILDFRNCKTAEDVGKVFAKKKNKDMFKVLKQTTQKEEIE